MDFQLLVNLKKSSDTKIDHSNDSTYLSFEKKNNFGHLLQTVTNYINLIKIKAFYIEVYQNSSCVATHVCTDKCA